MPRPGRRERRTAMISQPIGITAKIVVNPHNGAPTTVELNGDPPRRTEKPATSNTFSASGPIAAPAGVAAWYGAARSAGVRPNRAAPPPAPRPRPRYRPPPSPTNGEGAHPHPPHRAPP